jgi:hypothetical protein
VYDTARNLFLVPEGVPAQALPVFVVSYSFDDLGPGSTVESPDKHEEAAERAYRGGF